MDSVEHQQVFELPSPTKQPFIPYFNPVTTKIPALHEDQPPTFVSKILNSPV